MKSEGHFGIWTDKYNQHLLVLYRIYLDYFEDEKDIYYNSIFYNKFVNKIYKKSSGKISEFL